MHFNSNLINKISLLIFIIVFTNVGIAQNESYLDSLDGKFALQFQISDNFNLTNFQGTTFSGKYNFSSSDALRLGLSLDFGDSEIDGKTNQYDSVNVVKINTTQNAFGFTLNTQYIKYISETNAITFFGGVGPFFSYSKTTNDGSTQGLPEDSKFKDKSEGFAFGIDLLMGVEWFFTSNMSLSTEYGLKFMYKSNKRTYDNELISRSTDESMYRVKGNNVNFGISVYF